MNFFVINFLGFYLEIPMASSEREAFIKVVHSIARLQISHSESKQNVENHFLIKLPVRSMSFAIFLMTLFR